jgi:hypothetical protein
MIYIIGYFLIMLLIYAFDAFVGFDIEFDGNDAPPLFFIAFFWPLTIVISFFYYINKLFFILKRNRITRQSNKRYLRIKIEQETAKIFEMVL